MRVQRALLIVSYKFLVGDVANFSSSELGFMASEWPRKFKLGALFGDTSSIFNQQQNFKVFLFSFINETIIITESNEVRTGPAPFKK